MKNEPKDTDIDFEFEDEGGDKLAKLKEEIKKLRSERQEYLDGWQRSRADYTNLKKNTEDEKGKIVELLKTDILENFLPVLDSFNMAFSNKKTWEAVDPNWRVGVEHIYNQLKGIMEDYGLEEIGKAGEEFNEELHDAKEVIETDEEKNDHKIAEVIQVGYKKDEYIIRPAKVKIYKLN